MWCLIVTGPLGVDEVYGPFKSVSQAKQWMLNYKIIGKVALLTFVNLDHLAGA